MFSLKSSLLLVAVFFLLGCQEGSRHTVNYLGNPPQNTQRKPFEQSHALNLAQKRAEALQKERELLEQKKELAKIEAQTKEKIAKIGMKKEIEVQKLKNDSQIKTASMQKEVKISEQMLKTKIAKEQNEMQKWWLLGIALALLIVLFFVYLMFKKRNEMQLQMAKERLEHERSLKEQELKVQMNMKLLETITSDKISPQHQERLILTFTGGSEQLEYKNEEQKTAED